jgi:hypothetical protein
MIFVTEGFKTINDWADFWRYQIGVNIIPANTRKKETYESWKEWQDNPIREDLHDEWKASGAFNNGMAVVLGEVWHNPIKKELYLIGIDLDNQKAIEEVAMNGLDDLARNVIVEQHYDDTTKAHIFLYSHKPFPKKSSDNSGHLNAKLDANDIPAIEVKGLGSHGILFVTPSIHKNGEPYQIIGTLDPVIADDFVNHIDNICRKYSIPYLGGNGTQVPIRDLFKSSFTIFEGHNRHEALMRAMESLLARNLGILSHDQIKSLAREWNDQHCSPPLDDKEFQKQWKCATDFIDKNSNQEQDEEKIELSNGNSKIQSAALILVELATLNAKLLFQDQYNTAYARVHIRDHDEIIRLESSKLKRYLAWLFYGNQHKVINIEAINNAIQVLQAKAEYEGPEITLNLRVAWGENREALYYDMTDPKWTCIRITDQCWTIIEDTPTLFNRFNQKAQVIPDRNYPESIFDDFLDLMHIYDQTQRLLCKVWSVTLLIPEISHTIHITLGEKGSSKSTFCKFMKRLVDPDRIELLTIPKDKSEFVQQLYHNYMVIYDNVNHLPRWFSDEACKAVTGIGNSKRGLYTNDEDVIYNYKRCIIVNGVNNSLTESDALDRSILTEFDRIPDEQRKEESEIEARFEEVRPKLFAYILDTLVKAIQMKPTIKELSRLPRMADFATWGEGIARAMGYNKMEFIRAHYDNTGKQNVEAIENNALAQSISKFVNTWYKEESQSCWFSFTSKLLEELNRIAYENSINIASKSWPKAVNHFTRKVRPILSNLREGLGIHVVIRKINSGPHRGISVVEIRKISSVSSVSSLDQVHAQNQGQNLEDKLEVKGTYPEQSIEPSLASPAQKSDREGSKGSEDVFHIEAGGELVAEAQKQMLPLQ